MLQTSITYRKATTEEITNGLDCQENPGMIVASTGQIEVDEVPVITKEYIQEQINELQEQLDLLP
jgi:hypothetical protein